MNINIGSEERTNPRFELVLQVRDKQGKSTGNVKSFSTDHASDMEKFFIRNSSVVKNKKSKKKVKAAKTEQQIKQAFKEIDIHTDKVRAQKGLED